jgi:cell division transport system ATP-binding protein
LADIVVDLRQAGIYQGDKAILTEVNFTLSKGEFAYLIGKTGSGKSSLLKTLYADLPLKEGKGKVADFDLTKLNRKSISRLRRKLGIVFQDFNLLADRTVYDNLLFVLQATGWKDRKNIATRIAGILSRVGLLEKRDSMPHELSGGEQQRVVIARALLNRPELIIADEPTGNLDPDTADEIMKLLRELASEHDATVLFATHDYRIIENYPARIIRCRKGSVMDEENFVI